MHYGLPRHLDMRNLVPGENTEVILWVYPQCRQLSLKPNHVQTNVTCANKQTRHLCAAAGRVASETRQNQAGIIYYPTAALKYVSMSSTPPLPPKRPRGRPKASKNGPNAKKVGPNQRISPDCDIEPAKKKQKIPGGTSTGEFVVLASC